MFNKSSFVTAQILDAIFVGFSHSFGLSCSKNCIDRKVFVFSEYLVVSQTDFFVKQAGDMFIENLVTDGSSRLLNERIITRSHNFVQSFEIMVGHAVV